jgi:hypothetical protein
MFGGGQKCDFGQISKVDSFDNAAAFR